jgi:Tetratricopeptide repeat
VELYRRVLGPNHPDTLTSMNLLAQTRRYPGELDDARQLLEQVLPARQEVLGPEHPDTLLSIETLAAVRRELGEV